MREHHVFFLYFLYHVLEPVAHRLVFGLELLSVVKHLLLAMHLVKGFSAEVCNLKKNKIYGLFAQTKKFKLFEQSS
jgi:hypothetical protein